MNRPENSGRGLMILAALIALLVIAGWAQENSSVKSIDLPADNPAAKLKPGPGVDTVELNCVGCHSTDYIVRQPASDAEHWQAEVSKMIKAFGASISDEDAKIIVHYLATAYRHPPSNTPAAKKANPDSVANKKKLHASQQH